ncbi:MAG TPA: DUF2277 family protein [Dehalococcoidia bacterium]|nr:DUF2277 family protein [Dehalococcoidia bacterium]
MCRSIKRLRERDEVAPEEAIREAALQYVRKISGYRQPSPKKAAAFEAAVEEIAAASARLLEGITGDGDVVGKVADGRRGRS